MCVKGKNNKKTDEDVGAKEKQNLKISPLEASPDWSVIRTQTDDGGSFLFSLVIMVLIVIIVIIRRVIVIISIMTI